MNTLFTIWAVISLFIMPIVYITLSIKMRKTLEQNSNDTDMVEELFNKLKQLHNDISKTYDGIDEQKITLDYICHLLTSIENTQDCLNAQKLTLDYICKLLKNIETTNDNNIIQDKLDKVLERINTLQENSKCQDYVRLYNMMASIKAGNKDIVNTIAKIKTDKTIKKQLHDTLYQNEILLDDVDVLERKYEKQQYEYMNLLEAAKVLCEYYEHTQNEQSKRRVKDSEEKNEADADDAMKRLNELIKKLYKIKEAQ